MKRNQEYFVSKVEIVNEKRNAIRIVESNERGIAETDFELQLDILNHRESKDWTLTLEKHLPNNHTQIIKIRTAKESVDSPLY